MPRPGEAHPPSFEPSVVTTGSARHDPTAWRETDIVVLLERAQEEARRNDGQRAWQDALIGASHERMVALVGALMQGRTRRQRLNDRCREVVHHVFMADLPGWLRRGEVTSLSREGFCGMFRLYAVRRLNELHGMLARRQELTGARNEAEWLGSMEGEDRRELMQAMAEASTMIEEIGRLPEEDLEIADLHLVREMSLAAISREKRRSPDAVKRSMDRIKARLASACGRCA